MSSAVDTKQPGSPSLQLVSFPAAGLQPKPPAAGPSLSVAALFPFGGAAPSLLGSPAALSPTGAAPAPLASKTVIHMTHLEQINDLFLKEYQENKKVDPPNPPQPHANADKDLKNDPNTKTADPNAIVEEKPIALKEEDLKTFETIVKDEGTNSTEQFQNIKHDAYPSVVPKIHLFKSKDSVRLYLKVPLPQKPKNGTAKEFGKAIRLEYRINGLLPPQLQQIDLVARLRINPTHGCARSIAIEKLKNELRHLRTLEGGENICQLLDGEAYGDKVIIYQKLYEKALIDLWETDNNVNLSPNDFILQILNALVFIHAKRIVHRDLKPDNLFLLGNNFKVADFDMACNSGESRNLRAGTLGYMSPEHIARYLNSQPFRRLYAPKLPISDKTEESPACDMWSFGILLWEFTNFPNLHPCHLSQQRLAPNAILSSLTDVHNAKAPTNNPLQELIHGCLQIDPSKRWSSQYALQFWLDSTQPKPVPQLAAPVAADAPKPPPTKPTGNDEKQHDKQSQAKRKDTAADEKEPVKDDKAKTSPSTKSTCLFSTGALVSAVVASVFV